MLTTPGPPRAQMSPPEALRTRVFVLPAFWGFWRGVSDFVLVRWEGCGGRRGWAIRGAFPRAWQGRDEAQSVGMGSGWGRQGRRRGRVGLLPSLGLVYPPAGSGGGGALDVAEVKDLTFHF
jgi:hypothetical protein